MSEESANRRYLSAIKELARVRKLQSNTPGIQLNTQINVGRQLGKARLASRMQALLQVRAPAPTEDRRGEASMNRRLGRV